MIGVLKQFDAYSLQARIFPALVAGLPTLALLFVIVPWDHFGLSQAVAGTMGVVLLFAFADVARRTGKAAQARLRTGTTPELWHRDNPEIATGAKDRYRNFMAKQIGLPAPTVDDETTDRPKADDFYDTAGNWLRDRTRDRKAFPILFGENVTYGYRRNLLGLKPIALSFNSIVITAAILILYFRPGYFEALPNIDEKLTIIAVAAVVHSAFMLLAATAASVREASRIYGRELILCCEKLMASGPAAARTASRKKASE